FPVFLSDGKHFLYETAGVSVEQNGIYVASLDGKENRRVLADAAAAGFAPTAHGTRGDILFIPRNNLMAQPFDAPSLQTSGDVFPVAENVALAQNNSSPVTASDNGVLLYWTGGGGGAAGGTYQLVWYDRAGKAATVGMPGNLFQPAISPDEKTIAFSKAAGGNNRDIWLRDLGRENEPRFTPDASFNQIPVWAPKTGDRVVFRSNRGGHPGDLYIRASSLSSQDEVLLSTANIKNVNQWSRDGKYIVYMEADPKT